METRQRKLNHDVDDHSDCHITLLPKDLMRAIVGCIAASSFLDLSNIKLCCKELLVVSEADDVFRRVSIPDAKFPVVPWHFNQDAAAFLQRCTECGNPEALLRQEMSDYFSHCQIERGFASLRAAAENGHAKASYVYEIVLLSIGRESNQKSGLHILNNIRRSSQKKSTVADCRSRVKHIIRQMWINNCLGLDHEEDCQETQLHQHDPSKTTTSAAVHLSQDDEMDGDMDCKFCAWNQEDNRYHRTVQGFALDKTTKF